jgi:hypothetical protein
MPYRRYDVLHKWRTPSFDDRTRDAIGKRLGEIRPCRFFAQEELRLLDDVVDRLLALDPKIDGRPPIGLWIDELLFENRGDGYRLEGAPPLQATWRIGLAALAGEARSRCTGGFFSLDRDAKDALLLAIQQGSVNAALWPGLDPAFFFSEILLKTVAGLFYTHPSAWNEIGFGGPASPRGYVRLGFNARDPWEAEETP